MKTKLILLKRIRPEVYEIHVNKIEQAKNLILSTTNKEFAEQMVVSFNNYERVKNQISKLKNELSMKDFIISKVSKASKKKISELNEKVLHLTNKKSE